ncbi:uncharacterized protein FOMMEDRAFT_154227 [Fomitiporia mediterranea MF3/22]|uniref:uncharacterized protein n=1 Tax=Fomitiporia mediterranea (strain MF3/22) TaxID=694068 RepID=UPI000440887D|nr:uncharacterized protein FOMMEDRAFT_154227 [Fomitiporia mediterranea MF3/22]EJD05057.1 hypothetical protein FOMMEDRAFT_154227 [Fomitiporia mediterranea MF3/22]
MQSSNDHIRYEKLAYILENTTSHARHLPVSSSHAFAYPTLALFVSLDSLESHCLNLGSGWIFGYSEAKYGWWRWRLTGLKSEGYLHDYDYSSTLDSDTGSSKINVNKNPRRNFIKEKLTSVLFRFGHDASQLDDAWMLTMPSYLGIEGINPLTVFYCYKKPGEIMSDCVTRLWIVVLEVHNTFGERHVYVLQTGSQHEDKATAPGFTHSWTFPRQFHVSPFNDRSGYYTCSITAPPHPPPSLSSSTATLALNKTNLSDSPIALPRIRIQLYTPDKKLKLTASLRSTSAVPLTTPTLLATLVRYPITLFLSFPRIAWQAFHLHYRRRLDVYARPEPRSIDPLLEGAFVGHEIDGTSPSTTQHGMELGTKGLLLRNEVQQNEDGFGIGGGVGWQPEGILERYARMRIEHLLELRSRETGIRVRLLSSNPAIKPRQFFPDPGIPKVVETPSHDRELRALLVVNGESKLQPLTTTELTIATRSSRAFLLMLTSPSPAHSLLLVRDTEGLLSVSDEHLFLAVFSPLVGSTNDSALVQRFLQRLRISPIPRSLVPLSVNKDKPGRKDQLNIPAVNPLDVGLSALQYFQTLVVISAFLTLAHLEKIIFTITGARFVRGTEPWGGWQRAVNIWLAQFPTGEVEGEDT